MIGTLHYYFYSPNSFYLDSRCLLGLEGGTYLLAQYVHAVPSSLLSFFFFSKNYTKSNPPSQYRCRPQASPVPRFTNPSTLKSYMILVDHVTSGISLFSRSFPPGKEPSSLPTPLILFVLGFDFKGISAVRARAGDLKLGGKEWIPSLMPERKNAPRSCEIDREPGS